MSLNICLISEEFPPETGWGGIGTYTYNLARGLVDQGHRVHVVSRTWENDGVHHVAGMNLHRVSVPLPSWKWGTYYLNLRFPETREILLWNYRAGDVVRRLCLVEDLDVIEAPEYHAQGLFLALRRRRIPVVIKLHTPAFLCRRINGVGPGGSQWDTFLSERLEYYATRGGHLVTSPSRNLAEQVAKHWHLGARAIEVIPNPIDVDLFRPDSTTAANERLLTYVGRVERRKGVESLAEAFLIIRKAFPSTRLRFIGQDHCSGPGGASMSGHLRRRFREAEIPDAAVEFTGRLDRTALPAAYQAAAICVIPSLYENFPYSCLEAMACGCAVVASAVGGIPEIISDGADGLLVPPGQPEVLAEAIMRLLADPELRRRLGSNARVSVCERFSRQAVCARTLRAYRSLIGMRDEG
jgi:glycosyltransferase involved in cell wall biosynthesis